MTSGARRLSQAIAEGDGISVIVQVADVAAARAAEAQGAEAVAVTAAGVGVRDAVSLPILCAEGAASAAASVGADAILLRIEGDLEEVAEAYGRALDSGYECVVDVHDDEELALALEHIDPEIFLISSRGAEAGEDALDRVLELLPDVPAGKLAIADVAAATREEVVALERAGFDAVLVAARDVSELVGGNHPEV